MPSTASWKPARSWPLFLVLLIAEIWLAHAIAFFAHEYAHSTLAWALGWKSNPLAIEYAHPTLSNLLYQGDIDEKVDYAPIFAAGNFVQAGLIAAAGMVLGNVLITYPIALWALAAAKRRASRTWALFAYFLTIASVGNFIDYVPVRTFAPNSDMYTFERGVGWSPRTVLLVLGIPFAVALAHFLVRLEPRTLRWLFPETPAHRWLLILFTGFALFGFYGSAGASASYGPVSNSISHISLYVFFPLMTVLTAWLTERRQRQTE